MLAITHAAIAAAGTSLILGTASPLSLGLAVIGSQLPDLDTTTSTIGKIFFPISSWIEDRFPHRSITHSLLATAGITIVSLAVNYFFLHGSIKAAIALPLGHLLACFSDTFTKQGVQLFYPEPVWAISVSNPRRRLKTGGAGELWVLAMAIALLVFGIYLANGGGITQKVSQNLGLRDGIVRVYNQNASTNKVYARITGYWTSDRTTADGKYLIIGNEGKEFIVTDGKGIYKTGEQIITSKVTTTVGEAARTEIRNLTFNDEDAIPALEELQKRLPGADIYINGELTVDFPEDVKIPIEPNQMVTATLSGNRIKFNYCGLDKAIALLRGQYAVGADDLLGETEGITTKGSLFVTKHYSIENYLVTTDAIKAIFTDLWGIDSPGTIKAACKEFNTFEQEYRNVFLPLMAWWLAAQRAKEKVNKNNLNFSILTVDSNFKPTLNWNSDMNEHLIRQCNVSNPPSNAEINLATQKLQSLPTKTWLRGKQEIWCLVAFLEQIKNTAKDGGFSFKIRSQITCSNAVELIAPRVACPEDLLDYLTVRLNKIES